MPTTTTVTVKSSGGDYTSLNAALAGEAADITSATGSDEIIRIDCYPMEDTTKVSSGPLTSGWKTSAANYVELRFVDSGGNPVYTSTWSTSLYRLNVNTTNGTVFYLPHTGLQHLHHTAGTFQVRATGTSQDFSGIFELHNDGDSDDGYAYFDGGGILVDELDDDVESWRAFKYDQSGTVRLRNWIAYCKNTGQSHAALNVPFNGGTIICESCTFDGYRYGILNQNAANTVTCTNTRFTNIQFDVLPTWADDGTNDGSYNLTDSDSPPSAWTNSITQADTPTISYLDDSNATMTSRDYRINSSDSGYEAGTTGVGYTTDVAGTTRTVTWDIGAHEASVSGGGPADPSNVVASNPSQTTVDVDWTDNTSGTLPHRIYYRVVGAGSWTFEALISAGTTTATVTGLVANTNYDVAVVAYDDPDESAYIFDTISTLGPTGSPSDGDVLGIALLGVEGNTVAPAKDGGLPGDVGASDGATVRTLPKGMNQGFCAHGDSVTFADAYNNVPAVVFDREGGLSMEQRSYWGTKAEVDADVGGTLGTNASDAAPSSAGIYQDARAAVTAAGFDALLYLRTNAVTTARNASLGEDTSLTAEGVTGEADMTTNVPAYDDTYRCSYSGDVTTIKQGAVTVVVTMEARLNGGSWVEIASRTHAGSFEIGGGLFEFGGTLVGTFAGFDGAGTDEIRCRLKEVTAAGISAMSCDFGTGAAGGADITWNTASPSYANMTPDPDEVVKYTVTGGVGSAE